MYSLANLRVIKTYVNREREREREREERREGKKARKGKKYIYRKEEMEFEVKNSE
jgi:hypothetical protein